jgi:hypothetical protein
LKLLISYDPLYCEAQAEMLMSKVENADRRTLEMQKVLSTSIKVENA